MPSRAGWTRPPARGRPSSTGWLARRSGWLQVEHRNGRRAWGGQGRDFDRPPPVDGDVALALFGPLHLAGQNYFAAGPLRHLDGQVLALVRRDPGDLDQVALVAGAGRRGREFDRVVHDAGDP